MIPSETIGPILGNAVALCMGELLRSDGSRSAFERYREQIKGIYRVANANRGERLSPDGLHAALAANNELGRAEAMLGWSDDQRQGFLAELRQEAA